MKQTKEIDWDVKIGDKIEFFDPLLSYEVSHYRPITMTQGLDFDPKWFTKAADGYNTHGSYTQFPKGSKQDRDWWSEEMRRCRDGYEVNGYYITGDNYYFINYYRILRVDNIEKAGQGRTEDFPAFLSKQYEFFHYINLCEILKKDCCSLKARGVGFSEIAAALGARIYTTTPNSRCVYACYAEGKLKPTIAKVWKQLNFLDTKTKIGHLRMVKDSDDHKRASKLDSEKKESGWMSEISTIVANTPDKLRGDRTDRLLLEEAGSWPGLITAYNQGQALVEISGKRLGTRIFWGKIPVPSQLEIVE